METNLYPTLNRKTKIFWKINSIYIDDFKRGYSNSAGLELFEDLDDKKWELCWYSSLCILDYLIDCIKTVNIYFVTASKI